LLLLRGAEGFGFFISTGEGKFTRERVNRKARPNPAEEANFSTFIRVLDAYLVPLLCGEQPLGGEVLPSAGSTGSFHSSLSPPLLAMMKLCILVGTTVGSYAFWALGDSLLGLSFGWSFALSGLGSLVGVVAGWKLARKLQE
jgi:hypothetical protein